MTAPGFFETPDKAGFADLGARDDGVPGEPGYSAAAIQDLRDQNII